VHVFIKAGGEGAPLLEIVLDLGDGTRLGLGRVVSRLRQGAALPQQVPALVEFVLDGPQGGAVLVGGVRVRTQAVAPSRQTVRGQAGRVDRRTAGEPRDHGAS